MTDDERRAKAAEIEASLRVWADGDVLGRLPGKVADAEILAGLAAAGPVVALCARPPRVVLLDRPPGVPLCAELHEAEDGTLTWRWVEQTFRITDDGEPPALAERLDDLYGAAWRCAGMGT